MRTAAPDVREAIDPLIQAGDFSAADSLLRGAVQGLAGAGHDDSVAVAKLLDSFADASWRKLARSPADAIPFSRRAIQIKSLSLGPFHPELATSLTILGRLLRRAGDADSARLVNQRALEIRERALGPDHPDVAVSLTSLAFLDADALDLVTARARHERALDIRERALPPGHSDIAASLNNLGLVLGRLGEYSLARQADERAVGIYEKLSPPDTGRLIAALNTYSTLLLNMQNYPAARPGCERAVILAERWKGAGPTALAGTLVNLGACLDNLGDTAGAGPVLVRARKLYEAALDSNDVAIAICLNCYAHWCRSAGDLASARAMYQRALSITRGARGDDHPDLAVICQDLAVVEDLSGSLDRKRELLERALAIRERTLPRQHPSLASSLFDLAYLDFRTQGSQVLERALRAEEIAREHTRLTIRAMSEPEALRYETVRPRALDLAVSAAMETPSRTSTRRVWDSLVRSRAIVLDEMANRHRTLFAGDSTLLGMSRELSRISGNLAALAVGGPSGIPPSRYREHFAGLVAQRDSLERVIAQKAVPFRRLTERGSIGLDDVARHLPARSVLVAYVRFERYPAGGRRPTALDASGLGHYALKRSEKEMMPEYAAFLLASGDSAAALIPLGSAGRVDSLVAAWRSEVLKGESRRSADLIGGRAGVALRRAIWDPIAPLVAGASRVIVVPDGSLQLISLGSLPTASGYLVESMPPLQTLSAERDLAQPTPTRPGSGLLVLGAPDYDRAPIPVAAIAPPNSVQRGSVQSDPSGRATFRSALPPCSGFGHGRLQRLAEAERESEEVAAIWRRAAAHEDATVLLGERASEEAFKRVAPGARAIHIATHGFFLEQPCGDEGPLLRSGLYLAGANRRNHASAGGEDGVLTAEEIATLDLSGLRFVTLSACETGLGDVATGEGVFGLRRAFQAAGAGALLMSLWKVDDLETRHWMREFYEAHLESHRDIFESARIASIRRLAAARREGRDGSPFAWGAFIATGSE